MWGNNALSVYNLYEETTLVSPNKLEENQI